MTKKLKQQIAELQSMMKEAYYSRSRGTPSGYNPDRWAAADMRRGDQQRDYDRNQERNAGLENETNNLQISINGKPWKVVAGKGTADSFEERNYLRGMQSWAEKKSAATGKKWTVSLTGAPISESLSEGLKDTVKQKAKQFGKYMTEPDTPQQAVVRDRAKNIDKIRKNKEQGVAEGFDYTMKDLGNDYAGFPSNHSMKHKMLKRIKPEKHQLYKDKMNNMHEFDDLLKLFKVAQARGDVIEQGVAEGAELKKVKREYNQAAKDAGGDWVGAGKAIDNMKKGLRQKDVDNKKAKSVEEGDVQEWKKSTKAPIKPRNFVAKNATTGGAGAHKDKKKAAKQGDTKHKKKAELAETATYARRLNALLESKLLTEKIRNFRK